MWIARLSLRSYRKILLWIFLILISLLIISGCQSSKSQLINKDLTASEWEAQLKLDSVRESIVLENFSYQQIKTQWLDWYDESRKRQVPALLFLPNGDLPNKELSNKEFSNEGEILQVAQTKKIPLVVFSHGLGGARDRYSYLGQYWASKGVASLHLQHVGSDRQVWQGSRITLPLRLRKAAGDEEALARVADVKFALSKLLQSPAGTLIDPQHLIIAGHSYGANTAMLIAGAEVERNKQRIKLQDPRFSAAILISAPPFYSAQKLDDILDKIKIPTLHITTTKDEITVPGFYSAPEDRLELFKATGGDYKLLAVFYGGSHNIFTGRRHRPELATQSQVIKAATQSLSLAFIVRGFSGEEKTLLDWQSEHKTLLADYQEIEHSDNPLSINRGNDLSIEQIDNTITR